MERRKHPRSLNNMKENHSEGSPCRKDNFSQLLRSHLILPNDVAFLIAEERLIWRLYTATERARWLNVAPHQSLFAIAGRDVGPEFYWRYIADSSGLSFFPRPEPYRLIYHKPQIMPFSTSFSFSQISENEKLTAMHRGQVVRLNLGHGVSWILIAPTPQSFSWLRNHMTSKSEMKDRILIASQQTIRQILYAQNKEWLLHQSLNHLVHINPDYSARCVITRNQKITFTVGLGVIIGWLIAMPATFIFMAVFVLLLIYSSVVLLRLAAPIVKPIYVKKNFRKARDLPIYTLLIPLRDEAQDVIADLVKALNHIHYPSEKLDIKFLIEEDDEKTLAIVYALTCQTLMEMVIIPVCKPRSKPKALAYALPLARGEYVVVYDAEDRPEPEQLLEAVAAFDEQGENLACVQAPLLIDNLNETWLTYLFAAEYAGLFLILLPALQALGFTIPLGGTSNHFRRQTLMEIGGWDPYNMTEDADIAVRLVRRGYAIDLISSPTYEEAPNCLHVWFSQRQRWMKGWMQTWLVHMRNPCALYRDLGMRAMIGFHLTFTAILISSLMHPIFFGITIWFLWTIVSSTAIYGLAETVFLIISIFNLMGGYLGSIIMAIEGARRSHLLSFNRSLTLIPIYWLMISVATIIALINLIRDPFHWSKTPHGLTKARHIL